MTENKNHDRILDFSRAVTGNLFFVPSGDFLDDPPESADPLGTPIGWNFVGSAL